MSDNLFGSEKESTSTKEVLDLAKQVAELSSKLDLATKETESKYKSWQDEKAQLEGKVKELTPWADTARKFDELTAKDPDEAIARIIAFKKKQAERANSKTQEGANVNQEEILKPVMERLDKMDEERQREKEERKIAEMQNAIIEAVDNLRSEGVPVDEKTPHEILSFMKNKGLREAEHVDLAARSLYSNALIEAKLKAKKKEQNTVDEPVVFGGSGFDGVETSEEPEETPSPKASQKSRYSNHEQMYKDDRLWKTLEKSL